MSIGERIRKRIQQDIVKTNFRSFDKRRYDDEVKEAPSSTFNFYKRCRKYYYTNVLKMNSKRYASMWINLMLKRVITGIHLNYFPALKSFVEEYVELAEEIYDIYYEVFTPSEFNDMVNSKVKNSSTIYFSEYIKIRLSKIDGKMVRIPMALKKNRKSENKYWFADGKLVYVYNKNSLDLEVYQERIRRFFYEKVYNNFGQKGISVKEYKVKLSEIMSNCKWYSCQFSEEVTIDLVAKAAEDELISVEVVGDEVVFKNE